MLYRLGMKCVRCGFEDVRALQIDHIVSTAPHRINPVTVLNSDKKKFDETFQLLCANCNWIKRYENGEYPKANHDVEQKHKSRFYPEFESAEDEQKAFELRRLLYGE